MFQHKQQKACLIELADHMRNKSFDTNCRQQFATSHDGPNQLDTLAKCFTRLIALMEEIINSFSKFKLTSLELKKMTENFMYAENIIDRNIWDRKLKPSYERVDYNSIEDSIHQDKKVFSDQKDAANKALKEAHSLLSHIENFILKDLNDLFEEARIILMSKFHKGDYENKYLRDANGYIKKEPKLPMKIENWLALSENSCKLLESLNAKAFQKNEAVNNLIKKISSTVSEQWMSTHKIGIDQVEQGLTSQGKLITQQYDVIKPFKKIDNENLTNYFLLNQKMKKELSGMDSAIRDTKLKMGTCKMLDETLLTQLGTPLLKIDPYYAENRRR